MSKKRIIVVSTSLVVVLTPVAAFYVSLPSATITKANYQLLAAGMSKDEVELILGSQPVKAGRVWVRRALVLHVPMKIENGTYIGHVYEGRDGSAFVIFDMQDRVKSSEWFDDSYHSVKRLFRWG